MEGRPEPPQQLPEQVIPESALAAIGELYLTARNLSNAKARDEELITAFQRRVHELEAQVGELTGDPQPNGKPEPEAAEAAVQAAAEQEEPPEPESEPAEPQEWS
jgi:hypothetical protein